MMVMMVMMMIMMMIMMMMMNHLHGNVIRHEQENEDNVVNKGMKKSITSGCDEDSENEVLAY